MNPALVFCVSAHVSEMGGDYNFEKRCKCMFCFTLQNVKYCISRSNWSSSRPFFPSVRPPTLNYSTQSLAASLEPCPRFLLQVVLWPLSLVCQRYQTGPLHSPLNKQCLKNVMSSAGSERSPWIPLGAGFMVPITNSCLVSFRAMIIRSFPVSSQDQAHHLTSDLISYSSRTLSWHWI